MTNRPTPHDTHADIVRFMTLARGGRDRRTAALLDDDERNTVPVTDSLGREQMTFVVTEAGKHRTTRTPPLLNADGTPATPLPTTTPEDNT